jgi:hypothetical protein
VSGTLKVSLWIVGVVLGLFLTDRFFLWMEGRGWMYWRKTKASPRSVGAALMEIHACLEPGKRIVVEELKREAEDEDGEAGPKDPGKGSPDGVE